MKCVWDIKFLSFIQPWKHFTLCLKHKSWSRTLRHVFHHGWFLPLILYFHPRRLNLLGFSGYPTFYNHNQPLVLPTNQQSTTYLKGYPSIASAGLCQAWCLGTLWFTLRREQCQLGTWTFARTGGRGKPLFFFKGLTKVPCQVESFSWSESWTLENGHKVTWSNETRGFQRVYLQASLLREPSPPNSWQGDDYEPCEAEEREIEGVGKYGKIW